MRKAVGLQHSAVRLRAALARNAAAGDTRKVVTVLFTDLVGSANLGDGSIPRRSGA